MAFKIDDLKSIVQRSRNSFRAELKGTDAWLWPNNVFVSAKVFGGVVYEIFMKLRWIDKQRFAHTADEEGLELHGREFAITRRGASQAQGDVSVPCEYPYTVSAGVIFRRDDGIEFQVTAPRTQPQFAVSAYLTVPVVCTTPGSIGNTLSMTPLFSSLSGLTGGVNTVFAGEAGIGQGADQEPLETWRQRILMRKRNPPMGGAAYDYEAWALNVPGVTRVFVRKNAYGPGTVGVWFLMDKAYPNGVAQPADEAAVQAYIDSVSPVTANVIVSTPVPDCIDVVVKGISPNTAQTREAVAAEIYAVFQKQARPGMPGDPFILRHSWLEQAVSNATGEDFNQGVTTPANDITFAAGFMPCLRSVQFIA